MGINTIPTLSWNPAARAGSYIVQVSTASDFSILVVNDSGITNTSHIANSLSAFTLYYWRVKAENAVGESGWSEVWNFMTGPAAPATPTLVSPANGAVDQPVSLSLIWNKVNTATSYYVQVATDTGFSSILTQDPSLTDSLKSISGLANSIVYYWRVRAKNTGGTSNWTSRWSFTTIIAAAGTPVLVSPVNGGTNQLVSLSLNWNKVSTATSYHVQVATDTSFTSIFSEDSSLTDSLKSITGLSNSTVYYWRVRAKNTGGTSNWTSRWSFTTIITAPVAPMLVQPANGDTNQPVTPTLRWSKVNGAATYHVQVSSSSSFTTISIEDSLLTDTSKVIAVLADSTTYYWRVRAVNMGGESGWSAVWNFVTGTTGVMPRNPSAPHAFSITGSFGTVRYGLPKQCHVSLKYYDLRGRLVASLINNIQGPGYYTLSVRNALSSNGSYIRVFEAGSFVKKELIAVVR